MLTAAPELMATEFNTISADDVPTVPSNTTVEPSDLRVRNHVAVPVALALESAVTAPAVETPFDDDPNAVDANRNSAKRVFPERPVFAVDGCVPE
tara:strand:- start:422 stop:706 length:285 start_codon:yes stop_codon:yes gene_type:complete